MMSSEVDETALRRLRAALVAKGKLAATSDETSPSAATLARRHARRSIERARDVDVKSFAKRLIRRGIAWYVDATASSAARDATEAMRHRISTELFNRSQEQLRLLEVNQELMKGEMRSRLQELEELAQAGLPVQPLRVDPVGVERRLGGDPAVIVALHRERYAETLRGLDPVLDVFRDDHGGDALRALRGTKRRSLGAVVSLHVIEYLELEHLLELLDLAADRLRPGGVFVAETLNPASLVAAGTSHALDPAPLRLLHPSLLALLCERAGFLTVDQRFFTTTDDQLPLVHGDDLPAWVDQVNASLTKLNDVLFGPQEYAVVARSGPT